MCLVLSNPSIIYGNFGIVCDVVKLFAFKQCKHGAIARDDKLFPE